MEPALRKAFPGRFGLNQAWLKGRLRHGQIGRSERPGWRRDGRWQLSWLDPKRLLNLSFVLPQSPLAKWLAAGCKGAGSRLGTYPGSPSTEEIRLTPLPHRRFNRGRLTNTGSRAANPGIRLVGSLEPVAKPGPHTRCSEQR